MKTRSKKRFLIAALVLSAVFAVSACGGGGTTSPGTSASDEPIDSSSTVSDEASVKLSENSAELDLHEKMTLTATTENTTEEVVWESSNPSVATVDANGEIRSVAVGTAVITASAGGASDSCTVEVFDSGAAPVLWVNYATAAIGLGDTLDITAQAMYKNNPAIDPAEYTWTAAEGAEEFISMTVKENTASVEGISSGETSVTVSTELYGITMSETISVIVRNLDVTFKVEGLEAGKGTYVAELSTMDTENTTTELDAKITVYENGTAVPDAEIVWEIEDENVVEIAGNVFTSVGVGKTTVVGTYGDNTITVVVNVTRPEVYTQSEIWLESLGDGVLDLSDTDIEGLPLGVYVGNDDKNLLISTDEETGKVTYDKSVLPLSVSDLGEKTIIVETEFARYISECGGIYTKVIRTADDLDGWFDLSKKSNPAANIWDGYFILGNDIDYTGREYTPKYNNPTDGDFRNGGFAGIFDGRNHVIKGFHTVGSSSGLIRWVGVSGIIRNIAFVDAIQEGNGSLISSVCIGTVENVFISVTVDAKEGTWGTGSSTLVSDLMTNTRIKKVFVEYNDRTGLSTSGYPLWSYHKTFDILSGGLYAVGVDQLWSHLGTDGDDTSTYGAYQTYEELRAAKIDFTGWENEFWTVKNGIPYPKAFGDEIQVEVSGENSYSSGSKAVMETSPYTEITLDEEAVAEGFSVHNNAVTIPAETTLETFTVTATSTIDPSKSASKTFAIAKSSTVTVEETTELDVYHLDDMFTIDLSEYKEDIAGSEVSAMIGSQPFSSAEYDEETGLLTLDKASLGKLFGDQTITFSITEVQDGLAVSQTTVMIDVYLISMEITTADELDKFMEIAKSYDTRASYWNGIFRLGNDIDYTGREYTSKWQTNETAFREGGFVGIFDGCGHVITNFHTVGMRGGLIGWVGPGGVIRNVAFVNAVNEGTGGIVSSVCIGTIENVYVSATVLNAKEGTLGKASTVITGDIMVETRINKVFVEYNGRTGSMTSGYPLWVYHQPYDILSGGLYAVGIDSVYAAMGDQGTETGVYGAYETYEELFAANVDFSSWENEFWTVKNGIPYPKAFGEVVEVEISNEDTICTVGMTVMIEASPYTEITLDEEALAAGFIVSNNIVTIPTETTLKTFTVTATSIIDPSKSISLTFRVESNEEPAVS